MSQVTHNMMSGKVFNLHMIKFLAFQVVKRTFPLSNCTTRSRKLNALVYLKHLKESQANSMCSVKIQFFLFLLNFLLILFPYILPSCLLLIRKFKRQLITRQTASPYEILFFFFFEGSYFIFFFPFIFISWRLITLQYCSGFCHTLT